MSNTVRSFTTLEEAESARAEVIKNWTPLVVECTANDFFAWPESLREKMKMFQPTGVQFTLPDRSLRQRVEEAVLTRYEGVSGLEETMRIEWFTSHPYRKILSE